MPQKPQPQKSFQTNNLEVQSDELSAETSRKSKKAREMQAEWVARISPEFQFVDRISWGAQRLVLIQRGEAPALTHGAAHGISREEPREYSL